MFRYYTVSIISTIIILQANASPVTKKDLDYVHYGDKDLLLDNFNTWHDNVEERFNDDEELQPLEVDEKATRRLFEWFSKLFKTTTPKPTTTTVVTTTESSYQHSLKERIFLRHLHRNLTEVLIKLADMYKHVSNVVEKREQNSILSKPRLSPNNHIFLRKIVKREVTEPKATKTNTSDVMKVTESLAKENVTATTQCPCGNITNVSGRRSASFTPSEVKNKLLLYLKESFQEINSKIESLRNVKEVFLDDNRFRIGYIMANIDALEINMLNLKKNMDENQQYWDDKKILELFDTLKVTNQAVSGLIDTLKKHIEKLSDEADIVKY